MASRDWREDTALSTDSDNEPTRSERRRSPRVRALYHIVITSEGMDEEQRITVGRTLDVSETGVRVETPGPLCIDESVRLEIAIEETVVNASGRVIHASRQGDLIEAGIEFTVIDDAERLALTRQH